MSEKPKNDEDDSDGEKNVEALLGCILTIKVLEASELVAADRGGLSDPYARISFEKQKKKTKVVKKTLTPVWNETFEFDISEVSGNILIELFDHDLFGSHDFLGCVEIPVRSLAVEAVRDEWFDLQPRSFRNDIVSGRMHLWVLAATKKNESEDQTGFDTYPWINLDSFRMPSQPRQYHGFRIYIASTFVDFSDELKALHAEVFPKLKALCESKGFTFTTVDMRLGMDERTDRTYMYDPNIARLCFHEIEQCRHISPRVNFFGLLGDRYGSSCLPLTLDKNEFMALRSSISEDAILDEKAKELEKLLEEWYALDENQVPNRFVLRSQVSGVAPSCPSGTDKHNEWIKIESILFNSMRTKSMKLLTTARQRKYLVSLLEQEITLGLLLPRDANEHGLCIIRGLANLRVVNPQSARYVDLKTRRSDALIDGIKEIRADMIDQERRALLNDLKVRVKEKMSNRCQYVQAQWQGLSATSSHLSEFCKVAFSLLQGPLRHEIYLQHSSVPLMARVILKGQPASMNDILRSARLGGGYAVWLGIIDYLSSRSDGSLKPLVVKGKQGSGVSTILAAALASCRYECGQNASNLETTIKEGTCLIYRHIGLTPASMTGGMLLAGMMTEIESLYGASTHHDMTVVVNIIDGQDLPAADVTGTSDPYVTIGLGSNVEKPKVKTKIKKRTLNPQWNESFNIDHVSVDDTLEIAVWDHDLIGSDDILGRASIALSTLPLNKKVSLVLPISKEEVKVISPTHTVNLKIIVVEAEDLLPVGQRMTVDPFVILWLGNTTSRKLETAFQKDTIRPTWNESFAFTFSEGEESIVLGEMWDNGGPAGEKMVVGHFTCDVSNMTFGECKDGWYDLELSSVKTLRKPSTGNEEKARKEISRGRVHLSITKERATGTTAKLLSDAEETNGSPEDPILDETQNNTTDSENAESASSKLPSKAGLADINVSAPRIRIEMTLISAVKSAEEAVGSKSWGGPWTYKELASSFMGGSSGLAMATASKPLVVIIDGLQNLAPTDLICSLKWLPSMLPRNAHLILGISCELESRVLSGLLQRKSTLRFLHMSEQASNNVEQSFGSEFARKLLLEYLGNRHPVANLSDNQRAAILSWFGPSSTPLLLHVLMEKALCTPSFDTEIPLLPSSDPVKSISKAILMLIETRIQHANCGRVDATRLWKFLDLLALCPTAAGGFSETELRAVLGEGKQDSIPGFLFSEVIMATKPLLAERVVGGRLVYCLRNLAIRDAIISRPSSQNIVAFNRGIVQKEMLGFVENLEEFDSGGQIHERKLILLPPVLEDLDKMADLEKLLGDLHHIDLRLSSGMLWDTLMRLKVIGPGESGELEECLQLLEENAGILDEYPRLLLQLALNWPDNSQIHDQAMQLDMRRRGTLFLAYIPNQRDLMKAEEDQKSKLTRKSSVVPTLNKPKKRVHGVEDTDLDILPPAAMDWKCAKPWIKWHNKPQSRDHCKLVLESQISQVNCVLYADEGSVILSAAAHGPLVLWSGATGEVIDTVNITGLGHKPVTIMSLSQDDTLLITGSEDGRICAWGTRMNDRNNATILPAAPKYFVNLHAQRVTGLAFLSNSLFVSCGDDREVKVADVETGSEKVSFAPFRLLTAAMDVCPAGEDDPGLIATGGMSAVKFWRGDSLVPRGALYHPLTRRVTAVKFSPRIRVDAASYPLVIAVAEWSDKIFLWRQQAAQKWTYTWCLQGHTDVVRSLAWAPCVRPNGIIWLASGGLDHSVTQWSVEILSQSVKDKDHISAPVKIYPVSAIGGHSGTVSYVTFHPQGTIAASASRDGSIRVWDLNATAAAAESVASPARHSAAVLSAGPGILESSVLCVTGGADGRIKVWNISLNGQLLASIEAKHAGAISSVCITATCRYVVSASNDGTIKRWDSQAAYACTAQVKAHRGGVSRMQAHPTGEFVLSVGASDGRVTVWDIVSMQDAVVLQSTAGQAILQAVFASDGKMIISADSSHVRLWNMDLGRQLLAKPLGEGITWAHVDFSGDGRFLVTGSGEIKSGGGRNETSEVRLVVWDASKGLQREGTLAVSGGLGAGIVATAISADARYISATLRDHWLHIWHLPTRMPLAGFRLGQEPTRALCCGVGWPYIIAGDVTGMLYFLEFVAPQPPSHGTPGQPTS